MEGICPWGSSPGIISSFAHPGFEGLLLVLPTALWWLPLPFLSVKWGCSFVPSRATGRPKVIITNDSNRQSPHCQALQARLLAPVSFIELFHLVPTTICQAGIRACAFQERKWYWEQEANWHKVTERGDDSRLTRVSARPQSLPGVGKYGACSQRTTGL